MLPVFNALIQHQANEGFIANIFPEGTTRSCLVSSTSSGEKSKISGEDLEYLTTRNHPTSAAILTVLIRRELLDVKQIPAKIGRLAMMHKNYSFFKALYDCGWPVKVRWFDCFPLSNTFLEYFSSLSCYDLFRH